MTHASSAPACLPCPNCGGALFIATGRIVGGRPRLAAQSCGNVYMSLRRPDKRAKDGTL